MKDLYRGIGRYGWWALLGVLLLLGAWGIHAHPGDAWKCPLCAQSLVEAVPPAGLDVPQVSRPLSLPDVWVPVPWDLAFPFASRAPPVG